MDSFLIDERRISPLYLLLLPLSLVISDFSSHKLYVVYSVIPKHFIFQGTNINGNVCFVLTKADLNENEVIFILAHMAKSALYYVQEIQTN